MHLVSIRLKETPGSPPGLRIQWGGHIRQHEADSVEAWLCGRSGRLVSEADRPVRGLLGPDWQVWAVPNETAGTLEGLGLVDYYAVMELRAPEG